MGVINQGPNVGTTTGTIRAHRPPECWTCHERREGEIYGLTANGQPVCETCRNEGRHVPNKNQDVRRRE